MSVIRLNESVTAEVKSHLFTESGEHFGFLLAENARGSNGPIFLVKHFYAIPDSHVRVSEGGWEVSTEALLNAINAAVREDLALVEVHNHPGGWSRFSPIDRKGFDEFVPYVLDSLPRRPYGATVWTEEGVYGEYFLQDGSSSEVRSITATGDHLTQLASRPSPEEGTVRFARQEPWFTQAGQQELEKLRVAIAGLGGTGSQIAQNLAYIGARDFVLVDDDVADHTNMNRLVTATPDDPGTQKVVLARRLIRSVAPESEVQAIPRSLQSPEALDALKEADVVFGCVDNDGARLVLNELALAYRIPLFDLGTGIKVESGSVSAAGGRVAVILPEGPCLHCMDELDLREAKHFLKEVSERKLDADLGYVEGISGEPAPSVVSLNAAVASCAINEFALFTSGVRPPTTFTELDLLGVAHEVPSQRLAPRTAQRQDGCVQCRMAGEGDRADISRYAETSALPDSKTAKFLGGS